MSEKFVNFDAEYENIEKNIGSLQNHRLNIKKF